MFGATVRRQVARGVVVALAVAGLATMGASPAGADTVTGTVTTSAGLLPAGVVSVVACPPSFSVCSPASNPSAVVDGSGGYTLDLSAFSPGVTRYLWVISTGTPGPLAFALSAYTVGTTGSPVNFTVLAAVVTAHLEHPTSPSPTPYGEGSGGIVVGAHAKAVDASGNVSLAVPPGTYSVTPYAGTTYSAGNVLLGTPSPLGPLADGAVVSAGTLSLASGRIEADVSIPAGLGAPDTTSGLLICAWPAEPVAVEATACSDGSPVLRGNAPSGVATLSPSRAVTPGRYNVSSAAAVLNAFPAPVGPYFSPPVDVTVADNAVESVTAAFSALTGAVAPAGGGSFPAGVTAVTVCRVALGLGDSCPTASAVATSGTGVGLPTGEYRVFVPAGTYHVAPSMGTAVAPSAGAAAGASPTEIGNSFSVEDDAYAVVAVSATADAGGFVGPARACLDPGSPIGTCPVFRGGSPASAGVSTVHLGHGTWNVVASAYFPSLGFGNAAPTPPAVLTVDATPGNNGPQSLGSFHVPAPPTGTVTGTVTVSGWSSGNNSAVQLCPLGSTPGPYCPGAMNVFLSSSPGLYSRVVPVGTYQILAGWYPGSVTPTPPPVVTPIGIVTVTDGSTTTCDLTLDSANAVPATNSCTGLATDADGIDDAVENAVPGADGNRDGVPTPSRRT